MRSARFLGHGRDLAVRRIDDQRSAFDAVHARQLRAAVDEQDVVAAGAGGARGRDQRAVGLAILVMAVPCAAFFS